MPRNHSRATYFIFRSERLPGPLFSIQDYDATITETGRRRWRIREGDYLVFTEGRGLKLRFLALAPVIQVTTEENELDGSVNTYVVIGEPSELPPELVLEWLMFSLTLISNFGRPWNHVRHKGRIPAVDVDTLEHQRIVWHRTVFYGLLRELPDNWRNFLEIESRSRQAAKSIEHVNDHPEKLALEPVAELLGLIDDLVVDPVRLAADVETVWREVLEPSTLADVVSVESDGSDDQWNLAEMLKLARRVLNTLPAARETVERLPWQETSQEERLQWRPHRW